MSSDEPCVLAAPVVDFHARLAAQPGAATRLLATMDEVGIARAVISAGGVVDLDRLSRQIVGSDILHSGEGGATPDNRAVLAAARGSGGRLIPFYFADPRRPVAAYRAVAADYRGLELSPAVHCAGFDDRRLLAYVEVAAEAAHPVYAACVAWPGGRPADLVALARRYPQTTFVLGHCGFIGIDVHALELAAPQPNVLVELSGCFTATARAAVERLGSDRVLFGTEYPLQHPRVELTKLATLGLPATDLALVAWRNAHRLLKEETDDA